jgi:glucoamylase
MQSITILTAILLVSTITAQQCTVEESMRTDCGYFGINQQLCESKGCCWKPVNLVEQKRGGTPWCFFPAGSNPCENITYSGVSNPGFDQSFYDKMYALFDANINIQGKGGVVAAPDPNTPGGSYYYHWMRDAALTMRTYMEINDMKLSAV